MRMLLYVDDLDRLGTDDKKAVEVRQTSQDKIAG
jgi:hypothetical protein